MAEEVSQTQEDVDVAGDADIHVNAPSAFPPAAQLPPTAQLPPPRLFRKPSLFTLQSLKRHMRNVWKLDDGIIWMDHRREWSIRLARSGRDAEEIRNAILSENDSYTLMYLLLFATLMPIGCSSIMMSELVSGGPSSPSSQEQGQQEFEFTFEFLLDWVFAIYHFMLMFGSVACIMNCHLVNVSLLACTKQNVRAWMLGSGWRIMELTQRFMQIWFVSFVLWIQLFLARWIRSHPDPEVVEVVKTVTVMLPGVGGAMGQTQQTQVLAKEILDPYRKKVYPAYVHVIMHVCPVFLTIVSLHGCRGFRSWAAHGEQLMRMVFHSCMDAHRCVESLQFVRDVGEWQRGKQSGLRLRVAPGGKKNSKHDQTQTTPAETNESTEEHYYMDAESVLECYEDRLIEMTLEDFEKEADFLKRAVKEKPTEDFVGGFGDGNADADPPEAEDVILIQPIADSATMQQLSTVGEGWTLRRKGSGMKMKKQIRGAHVVATT